MYFREKKLTSFPYRSHEIIRWHYAGGATKAVILGRVRDDAPRLPDDVLAKMSAAERDEATAWWTSHVDSRRVVSTVSLAKSAIRVEHVQRAVDERLMTAEIAASLYADLERVAAVLKRAGHKAPKSSKPARAPRPTIAEHADREEGHADQ